MTGRVLAVLASVVLVLSLTAPASAQCIFEQEAYEIAREAYIYAYPLVLMHVSFQQFTNYAEPTGIVTQAPYNQFSHAKAFPPADFKTVVRPNVDTLYSSANLDLGPEPMVLSVPASGRYFMLPLLSLWTDVFAVPGTRTTGPNTARDFLLVGPEWRGKVPSGLEVIRSPTRFAGIGGRTQTNGVADYKNVHKTQAGYRLTPLSAWGKGNYVPPKGKVDPAIDMKTPPPVQIEKIDAATYFARFAAVLKDNPPGSFDYPMIHRLERVGFKQVNVSISMPRRRRSNWHSSAPSRTARRRSPKRPSRPAAKARRAGSTRPVAARTGWTTAIAPASPCAVSAKTCRRTPCIRRFRPIAKAGPSTATAGMFSISLRVGSRRSMPSGR